VNRPATLGVRFIERAQTPYAGWRYRPGVRESDTSVTGWQILALTSASRAGIAVNPAVWRGALDWVEEMTEPGIYRVGYNRRGRGSLGMTATGVAIRLYADQPTADPAVRGGMATLREELPGWPDGGRPQTGNPPDINYWYFGTLVARRAGGDLWRYWNRSLTDAIGARQEPRGEAKGSFPPPGRWGRIGGRIMTTALMTQLLLHRHESETVFR
jgi:hypothetical protein